MQLRANVWRQSLLFYGSGDIMYTSKCTTVIRHTHSKKQSTLLHSTRPRHTVTLITNYPTLSSRQEYRRQAFTIPLAQYLVAAKVRLVDRRRGVFVEDVKALPSETAHRARLTTANTDKNTEDTRRLILRVFSHTASSIASGVDDHSWKILPTPRVVPI